MPFRLAGLMTGGTNEPARRCSEADKMFKMPNPNYYLP